MEQRTRWLGTFIVAVLMVAAAGCGNQNNTGQTGTNGENNNSGGGNSQTAQTNFAEPQDVFEAGKKALAKGDYKTFVLLHSEEARNAKAGTQVVKTMVGTELKTFAPEVAKLVEQLPPGVAQTIKPAQKQVFAKYKPTGADYKIAVKTVTSIVNERPRGDKLRNVLISTGKLSKQRDDFLADSFAATKEKLPAYKNGSLKNVKITGDRASGTIVYPEGKSQPVMFRKTNNGWRIDVSNVELENQFANVIGPPLD